MENETVAAVPRILVIDDDEQIRAVLKQVLQEHGYEVYEAADGWEGAKLLHEQPVDLVIVDLFMPKKDGVETILDIRRTRPDVKTIAISGGGLLGELEFLSHAQTFGADRSFAKPFRLDELMDAVRELVGLRTTVAYKLSDLVHAAAVGDVDLIGSTGESAIHCRPHLARRRNSASKPSAKHYR